MKYSRILLAEMFIFSPIRVQTPKACCSTKYRSLFMPERWLKTDSNLLK